jgi:hypothetical protein
MPRIPSPFRGRVREGVNRKREGVLIEPCHECGAEIRDPYKTCKEIFEAILVKDYSELGYAAVHQLVVDCYVLQHPVGHSPRSNAYHIMNLCGILEHGRNPGAGTNDGIKGTDQEAKYRAFPELEAPEDQGPVTVADVVGANDLEEHKTLMQKWAKSVWEAWAFHQDWARQAAREREGG